VKLAPFSLNENGILHRPGRRSLAENALSSRHLCFFRYRSIEDRRGKALNRPFGTAIEVEDHDTVRALLRQRCRQIQCALRPNVPEPSKGAAIYPELSLVQTVCVEKRVGGSSHRQARAIKAGSGTRRGSERQLLNGVHRQREDFPPLQHRARKLHVAYDTRELTTNRLRKVHSAGILHQDVEACAGTRHIQLDTVLLQSSIHRAGEFAVNKDLRKIVELVERQFTVHRLRDGRSVEHVSIRLPEIFHGEWKLAVYGLRKHLPQ